jgi:SAM-dependent methyltransferase
MGHLNGRLLWHKYAEKYFQNAKSILEIGPAGYPTYYEKELKQHSDNHKYVVLDIGKDFISGAENNPDFILSGNPLKYPIEDNFFDIVFSDQVLAHVEYFWLWYGELIRVTKPGGYIITINAYSYPPCPSPIDAWRVHSDGMKVLNKYYGIETVLSVTESVELEKYHIPLKPGYYIPGASIANPYGNISKKTLRINLAKSYWNRFVGRIPKIRALLLNPVQASFDTITIACKMPILIGEPGLKDHKKV